MKTGPRPWTPAWRQSADLSFRRTLSDLKQTIHEENIVVYSASK
jgi:hypothetical protein